MRVVMARDLGDSPREQMAGARWLILTASEIPTSTTLLMFTELDDILVAVDHRGSQPEPGLWQRAVHCIMICLLYTSPSPRDKRQSRMPSSA